MFISVFMDLALTISRGISTCYLKVSSQNKTSRWFQVFINTKPGHRRRVSHPFSGCAPPERSPGTAYRAPRERCRSCSRSTYPSRRSRSAALPLVRLSGSQRLRCWWSRRTASPFRSSYTSLSKQLNLTIIDTLPISNQHNATMNT